MHTSLKSKYILTHYQKDLHMSLCILSTWRYLNLFISLHSRKKGQKNLYILVCKESVWGVQDVWESVVVSVTAVVTEQVGSLVYAWTEEELVPRFDVQEGVRQTTAFCHMWLLQTHYLPGGVGYRHDQLSQQNCTGNARITGWVTRNYSMRLRWDRKLGERNKKLINVLVTFYQVQDLTWMGHFLSTLSSPHGCKQSFPWGTRGSQ